MLPASRSFIGRTKGGRGVISRTPLWETLGSVDNYLSSFSRRGVVQERRLRQPGRRSHRSFSAPPSSLLLLSPSSTLPFLLLPSFSLSPHRLVSAGVGGTPPSSAPLSSLCSFYSLCSFFAPLLSLLLPSSLLFSSASSSLLPAPLPCLCSSSFLNAPPSSFLSFLFLVSSVGSGCIVFPPHFSESSIRRSHCYIDDL